MRKAVVDVGSNSVLLTVEEEREGRWFRVDETSEVTSLGEGTKTTGLLSEPGIARTLAALSRAFDKAHQLGCSEVVAGATMAARIATNTGHFLDRAQRQGTPVVVLTGEQEAELGFRSVGDDPAFAAYPLITVVDVGGQSTELVTAEREGAGWRPIFRRSFPVGTLGLRGTALSDESPGPSAILNAVREIDDLIGLVYLPGKSGHAIALGATGTNLITIRERMTEWDPIKVHAAWLDYEEVSKAAGWLCGMSDRERRDVVGMEPGRERTLHIGALILERFLHASRSPGCSVSVRGWRHALLEEGLPRD